MHPPRGRGPMHPRRGRGPVSGSRARGQPPPPASGDPSAPLDPGVAATASSGAGHQIPPAPDEHGGSLPLVPGVAAKGAGQIPMAPDEHGAPLLGFAASGVFQIGSFSFDDGILGAASRAALVAASGTRSLIKIPVAPRGNRDPPASILGAPSASASDHTSSCPSANLSIDLSYQQLGAPVSPKEFQEKSCLLREALSVQDPDCGPSTPPVSHEQKLPRPNCCRNRASQGRPNASNSKFPSANEQKKNFDQQKRDFRTYLNNSCVQMADTMWQQKSLSLHIDYNQLKHEDKDLAYDIANNFEEIKGTLHVVTREFLLEQFSAKAPDGRFSSYKMLEDNIQCFARLCFNSMPKSIMSLVDFLNMHKTTTRNLFRGHRKCKYLVAIVSPSARNMLQKIVTFITKSHKAGLTWDGKWKLEDWEVLDGHRVQLHTDALRQVDRSMFHNDLEAIASEIVVKLTIYGLYPAYLLDLYQQLQKSETTAISDDDYMGWFYDYLQHHPALLSSKSRSTLLKGLYGIAIHLDYNKKPKYDAIFKDSSFVAAWTKFVYKGRKKTHPILWKVFWDDEFPDETTDPRSWRRPYKDLVGDLLKMVRHILVHSDRATRTGSNGQTMKHSCETELFAADTYKRFFPEFLKLIFKKGMMTGEFATEWEFYKATKDFVYHELPQMP